MPAPRTPTAPSPLHDAGPVLWSGSAQNGWMPLVLVVVLGQGAVMNLMLGRLHDYASYLNLAHVLVLGVLELFGKVSVRIDARELVIRYGYIGWLRQRVALARVTAARAFELEPLAHGGWGYRGSLRWFGRASVVVRGGAALGLELDGGKRFSITLDDAAGAARQVNALITRGTDTGSAPS